MIYFLFAAMIFGGLSSRAQTLADRGGIPPTSVAAIILGGLSILSLLLLAIWGFLAVKWYWALAAVATCFLAPFFVTRGNFPFFYQAAPILNVAVIGVTIGLWVWGWPL